MLKDEYERGYKDGYADGRNRAISQQDKEQIRRQVEDTVNDFKSDKSVDLAKAFANPQYIFAVDQELNVLDQANRECKLTGGDLLRTVRAPNADDDSAKTALMVVISGKNGSCAVGSQINVAIEDLQEMLNTFSQKVDEGMQQMDKSKNGNSAEEVEATEVSSDNAEIQMN